jgi:hypothetical protein
MSNPWQDYFVTFENYSTYLGAGISRIPENKQSPKYLDKDMKLTMAIKILLTLTVILFTLISEN